MKMTLETAKQILSGAYRSSLVDSEFGDAEYYWNKKVPGGGGEYQIASGYRSSKKSGSHITIVGLDTFEGDDAEALFSCGICARVESNNGPVDDNWVTDAEMESRKYIYPFSDERN